MSEVALSIKNLSVEFTTDSGIVNAVNDLSLDVMTGETVAVVGESGSGKSVSVMAILGLLAGNGQITSGSITWFGQELVGMANPELNKIRGKEIAMVFQDPLSALNPVHTVGRQISEILKIHEELNNKEIRSRVLELLGLVGIPQPQSRIDQYPHEFSGGMRQRIMIALAIACQPKLLIADEPTTALDVTVQAQILELLQRVCAEVGASIMLITHDLGVVAGTAERVVVMYAGRIIEEASVDELFYSPHHPYSYSLLRSLPRLDSHKEKLWAIPGMPPSLLNMKPGCAFMPRCDNAQVGVCDVEHPPTVTLNGRKIACYNPIPETLWVQ